MFGCVVVHASPLSLFMPGKTWESAASRKAAGRVVKELTQHLRLSRRDAAELTGYSFQRIQQLAHES